MKPFLHTLLICLGLALAPAVWAEAGPHRHGQEAGDKLDNLSAAAQPPCCPTEGKPAQTAVGGQPAPARLATADAPRPTAGEPCRKPDADDKPCAGPCAERKPCKQHEGCCCRMHTGARDCDQGRDCRHMAGRHGGEGPCDKGGRNEAELSARIHQLERRLDMMQSVLETLLERPEGGRPMGGQHGPR